MSKLKSISFADVDLKTFLNFEFLEDSSNEVKANQEDGQVINNVNKGGQNNED